jgi:hypothetical protein
MQARSWKARVAQANIDRLTTGKHTDADVALWEAKAIAWEEIQRNRRLHYSKAGEEVPTKKAAILMCEHIRKNLGTCSREMHKTVNTYVEETRKLIAKRRQDYNLRNSRITSWHPPEHGAITSKAQINAQARAAIRPLLVDLFKGTCLEKAELWISISTLNMSSVSVEKYAGTGRHDVGRVYAISVEVPAIWFPSIHAFGLSKRIIDGKPALILRRESRVRNHSLSEFYVAGPGSNGEPKTGWIDSFRETRKEGAK